MVLYVDTRWFRPLRLDNRPIHWIKALLFGKKGIELAKYFLILQLLGC